MSALGWACAVVLALALLGVADAQALGRCRNHPWCDTSLSPDQRAQLLLGALNQDEKVSLLDSGGSVARLDVPALQITDGALGAGGLGAGRERATAMPAAISLSAAFDPALALRYGAVVGDEVKHRGFDADFGPTVNIMRTPLGGRTYEAYGEDPYLAAQMAVGWINGLQAQGVMANVKHFAANNQEGQGGVPPGSGAVGGRFNVNANVDERTLHEIYFPAFEAAVRRGHSATVMCAYNKVNGTYACENHDLLTRYLRDEFGFGGFVISDAGAAHDTAPSLLNGLNYDSVGNAYSPPMVDAALASGQVSVATLDQRVREILRTLFAYGFFDRGAYTDNTAQIDQSAHALEARRVAEQGATLLKNASLLPLDPSRVKSIAVIGSPANRYVRGSGSSEVSPFSTTNVLQGIERRAPAGVRVSYDDGSDPLRAASVARSSDVAVVVAADSESEGTDKACLALSCPSVGLPDIADGANPQVSTSDQDGLIRQVAAANPHTAVVLETGAPVLTPWREEVGALLEAWYPGQEGGTAIARILFGDVDPGGRLPATFPQQQSDIPTAGDLKQYPGVADQETYKEGVLVGYRFYDAHNIAPAYPFGFGLSYSTYRYSDLHIQASSSTAGPAATVTATVTNTGGRAGTAVPELYLGLPSPAPGVVQPPAQLKGFAKVTLDRGQSTRVSFPLDARAFSYWDANQHRWRVTAGCYRVMVGGSSRDLPLRGSVSYGSAVCPDATVALGSAPRGSLRVCASRRHLLVHFPRAVRRAGVRRVVMFINGHLQSRLSGRRATMLVSLVGRAREVSHVRIVILTRHGLRTIRRTYHPCRTRLARHRAHRHHRRR